MEHAQVPGIAARASSPHDLADVGAFAAFEDVDLDS
jgi:hypothetical protein